MMRYSEQACFEEAAEAGEAALRIQADSAGIHECLAGVLEQLERDQEAREHHQRADELRRP